MPEDHTIRQTGVNPAGHTLRLDREAVASDADPAATAAVNAQVEAAIAEARASGHATINDGFLNLGGETHIDSASVAGPGATLNISNTDPEPEAEP